MSHGNRRSVFDEVLDRMLARIPAHDPEWTDFNEHDPGITLVEVFAFVLANLLGRAGEVPEDSRRRAVRALIVAGGAAGLVMLVRRRRGG